MEDERIELARRLREAREYLGFSQAQVAEFLGLHRPSVSEMEAGRRGVSTLELVRLARLYQRPVEWFLGTAAPAPLSRQVLSLVAGLDEGDRSEVLRFAEYLQWRKGRRRTDAEATEPEAGATAAEAPDHP